jgi:hypothetical protein
MLKKIGKIGIPLLAFAAMLAVPAQKASAAVRFGVAIGGGPAYGYSAYPAYPEAYQPVYPAYSYPAQSYAYTYNSYRDNDRQYMEHTSRGRENDRGREDRNWRRGDSHNDGNGRRGR